MKKSYHSWIGVKVMVLSSVLLAGVVAVAAVPASEEGEGAPAFAEALHRARSGGPADFGLLVDCLGTGRVRSMEVFETGVAIWDRDVQVEVPEELRRRLVAALDDADFPSFPARHGGDVAPDADPPSKPSEPSEPGEPSEPREPARAERVICRVDARIDGHRKTSIQLAQGEQSDELDSLANDLLDTVEPLAEKGTRAGSLAEAIAKLSTGELAPAGFRLRFVEIPRRDERDVPGAILRVENRQLTVQPYLPGEMVGEVSASELGEERLSELFDALGKAEMGDLPPNLWAEDQLEVHAEMLGHGKTVHARPFSRLRTENPTAAQERFDTLVSLLRELRSTEL